MKQFLYCLTIAILIASCNSGSKPAEQQKPDSLPAADNTRLKADSGKMNTDVAVTTALTIAPLDNSGDLGQVTFSQREKTLFYYNSKTKKGEINLNGKKYELTSYSFNKDSYTLSGNGVTVNAPNCKYKESKGEDCSYGTIPEVEIKLGTSVLLLQKVDVQDCPAY